VTVTSYVVASGDTLRGIGNRTGAGSEAIAAANALEAPYTVRVGQRLVIPAGRYHEVLAGQSGIAIARAYGVSWASLIQENALVEPYVLRVGQRLRLPASGAPASPRSIEDQAQAFHLDIEGIMAGNQPAGPAVTAAARPSAPATGPATGPVTTPATGPGRFAWPLTGTLLQRFGPAGNGRVNNGINIAAAPGTPVRAAAAGTVTYADDEIALFGGLILIDHGGGWSSTYAHLDQLSVTVGQSVRAGQVIGTSGESGQVQQPQLHFEIRRDRRPVDPLRQLPPR
jgi:murein DD-endopeptidase MepM/ murein hydrolase activator NlpD